MGPTGDKKRSYQRYPVLALAAIGFVGGVTESWGAPLTFNTALPVFGGEFIFREQFVFIKSSDDPSALDRDLEVFGAVSVLGYGVNRNLALFGVLPYLDKKLELTPDSQRIARDTNGIGDFTLFGRYTLFQHDVPGRTSRIAPFVGVETPTGKDDEWDRFGRLPQPLQLGSGSWDPFAGVVATYQTLDFQVDAQIAYKANTEANNFEFGDELGIDGSLQYRLWPRRLGPGVPGFLYGLFEANFIYQDKNEIASVEDPDSQGCAMLAEWGIITTFAA